MPVRVSCHACGAGFRISDELYEKRFAGRHAKLRCKKCQAVIEVDGTGGIAKDGTEPERPLENDGAPSEPALSAADTASEPSLSAADGAASESSLRAVAGPHDTVDLTPAPVPRSERTHAASAPRRRRWPAVLGAAAVIAAGAAFFAPRSAPPEPPSASPVAAVEPPSPAAATPQPVVATPEPTPATPEPAVTTPEPAAAMPEPAPATPEPAPAKPSHDEAALARMLRWATKQAEDCHRGGRAAGTANVTVRFGQNGRVISALIAEESIANAPVGQCITAYMKAMTIPPFEGPELEITREIVLR